MDDLKKDLEKAFLESPGDSFAIYQLKHTQETRDLRFASMNQVLLAGKTIDREKYELLYIGDLPGKEIQKPGEVPEEIYARFNFMKPEFFTGHSLSMSDIVGLKQNGRITFHYVDSFGFPEVKGFLPDNLLHSAEISLEDDYSMIDGIMGNNGRNPAREEATPPPEVKPEDRLPLREQLRQVMQENTGSFPHAKEARKPTFER